jgi:hypothetical protein
MTIDLHRVRIETGRLPSDTRVYLDGKPLRYLKSISFEQDVGYLPTLTIEMASPEVEMDGDAAVAILLNGERYRLVKD